IASHVMNMIPATVLPVVEIATNYKTFQDRDIVNPWDINKDNELKYTRWTSTWARKLAPKMGLAPVQLEHLVFGYTGGFGRMASSVSDFVANQAGYGTEKPGQAWSRLPVVSQFYTQGIDESSASLQQLYRLADEAEGVKASINQFRRRGETAKADALYNENKW